MVREKRLLRIGDEQGIIGWGEEHDIPCHNAEICFRILCDGQTVGVLRCVLV